MPKPRAGWERRILYDSPGGATATTVVTHATTINVNKTLEKSDTTDRGDGSSVPKNTQQAVQLVRSITATINYWDGDTIIADFIAAAETGVPIAILVERYSGNDTEFDGDCLVEYDSTGELTGGQPVEFTLTPTQDLGRSWSDS